MKTVALIPARGGSKGIPRKNLTQVGGKSLLQRAIEAAKGCSNIDAVFVSTEDAEIASEAKRWGAQVVKRPQEFAQDQSSSESVLIHAIEVLATENIKPNYLIFIQCTSPFLESADLSGLINKFDEQKADSAFIATRTHQFLWTENPDGTAKAINHDSTFRPRRQDRESQFTETGAAYAMKVEGFLKSKHRFFGKTVLYEIPEERSIDVDSPNDLIIAQSISDLIQERIAKK